MSSPANKPRPWILERATNNFGYRPAIESGPRLWKISFAENVDVMSFMARQLKSDTSYGNAVVVGGTPRQPCIEWDVPQQRQCGLTDEAEFVQQVRQRTLVRPC